MSRHERARPRAGPRRRSGGSGACSPTSAPGASADARCPPTSPPGSTTRWPAWSPSARPRRPPRSTPPRARSSRCARAGCRAWPPRQPRSSCSASAALAAANLGHRDQSGVEHGCGLRRAAAPPRARPAPAPPRRAPVRPQAAGLTAADAAPGSPATSAGSLEAAPSLRAPARVYGQPDRSPAPAATPPSPPALRAAPAPGRRVTDGASVTPCPSTPRRPRSSCTPRRAGGASWRPGAATAPADWPAPPSLRETGAVSAPTTRTVTPRSSSTYASPPSWSGRWRSPTAPSAPASRSTVTVDGSPRRGRGGPRRRRRPAARLPRAASAASGWSTTPR